MFRTKLGHYGPLGSRKRFPTPFLPICPIPPGFVPPTRFALTHDGATRHAPEGRAGLTGCLGRRQRRGRRTQKQISITLTTFLRAMSEMFRVLCLGAGIQSTTILLMSCHGILPKLDAAVFADTQWEPTEVYGHLEWLEKEATSRGIAIYRISKGNLGLDVLAHRFDFYGERYQANVPLYILRPDGSKGMLRRECTRAYKIRPLERFVRLNLLGLRPRQRPKPRAVELWFGISADEGLRLRTSDASWKLNVYPLCNLPYNMLRSPMTRADCAQWLEMNYPHRNVPRSACTGCPFRSDADWLWLRERAPEDWEKAVRFDQEIRHMHGVKGQAFLHWRRIPLSEAVQRADSRRKASLNGWLNDCSGLCGV